MTARPDRSAGGSASISDPAVIATGGFTVNGSGGTATTSQTVATFTDPAGAEALGDYSASIDWGDSQNSPGAVTFNSGTGVFTVKGAHTYAEGARTSSKVTISPRHRHPGHGEQLRLDQ